MMPEVVRGAVSVDPVNGSSPKVVDTPRIPPPSEATLARAGLLQPFRNPEGMRPRLRRIVAVFRASRHVPLTASSRLAPHFTDGCRGFAALANFGNGAAGCGAAVLEQIDGC
jgi:hypothetical protein